MQITGSCKFKILRHPGHSAAETVVEGCRDSPFGIRICGNVCMESDVEVEEGCSFGDIEGRPCSYVVR
jgi:hypothetical protein